MPRSPTLSLSANITSSPLPALLTFLTCAHFSVNICCVNYMAVTAAHSSLLPPAHQTAFFQYRQDRCLKLILHPERFIYIMQRKAWVESATWKMHFCLKPQSIFIPTSCVFVIWVLAFSQENWKL